MQQAFEKRKNPRRSVTYPAFLDLGDGSAARECLLCDASQEGAQITVADPQSLPDEFILALTSDGAARRRCRVMWRTENQVGVAFMKDVKGTPAPKRTAFAPRETTGLPAAAAPVPDQVDIDTLTP